MYRLSLGQEKRSLHLAQDGLTRSAVLLTLFNELVVSVNLAAQSLHPLGRFFEVSALARKLVRYARRSINKRL